MMQKIINGILQSCSSIVAIWSMLIIRIKSHLVLTWSKQLEKCPIKKGKLFVEKVHTIPVSQRHQLQTEWWLYTIKKERSIGDAFVEIFRHLFVVYFFSYKFSIYVDTYFVYGFYFLHIFFSLLCDEVELLSSAINSFKHVASRFHNFGFYVNFSSWAKKREE